MACSIQLPATIPQCTTKSTRAHFTAMLGAQQHSDRAHSSVEPHLLQQSTPINWQLSTAGHYYDTSTIVYLQEEAPVDIVTPWRANQDATFEWLPCK
jgi:hypothetical protein